MLDGTNEGVWGVLGWGVLGCGGCGEGRRGGDGGRGGRRGKWREGEMGWWEGEERKRGEKERREGEERRRERERDRWLEQGDEEAVAKRLGVCNSWKMNETREEGGCLWLLGDPGGGGGCF